MNNNIAQNRAHICRKLRCDAVLGNFGDIHVEINVFVTTCLQTTSCSKTRNFYTPAHVRIDVYIVHFSTYE